MRAAPLVEVDLGEGVRAAFTTARPPYPRGTTSAGPSFNLGLGLEDTEPVVLGRRESLGVGFGVPLAWAEQVHGSQVHHVRHRPADARPVARADGLVTGCDDVGLAVVVADCVPVLLGDGAAGVVGTAHAGRQGLVAGVVPAVVEAMVGLGARRERIRAVVGPAACGRCYEVPEALRAEVDAQVPGTASRTRWGTPALDLPGGVRSQLVGAGVPHVRGVGSCTIEDERWFSHRGTARGRSPGRFAGLVTLSPPMSTGT